VGDTVYETLPYAAKDGGEIAVDPVELFDVAPMYGELGDVGVDSHVVEPDYDTGYDDASLVGAAARHYAETGEFAAELVAAVAESEAPSYTYGYYPVVDTVSHRYGPDSEQYGAQVAAVCGALERAFDSLDDETAAATVVCLVADHGQVPVDSPTELGETGVLEHVPTDRSGAPLVLGGPRNVHLRVTDEAAARECLADVDALVLSKDEALDEGLWGQGQPEPAFERNCGDLVVIPRTDALWHEGEPDELALAGMHGGLHPQEALVPFGVARASDLV
ncbi:MAG: alkaline phosphatase family protein, partial [Halobacterium sp.]